MRKGFKTVNMEAIIGKVMWIEQVNLIELNTIEQQSNEVTSNEP